jgi:hypothetical protein
MSLTVKLALSPCWSRRRSRHARRMPRLPEAQRPRQGVVARPGPAPALLIAGDSSAAGVGVVTSARRWPCCCSRRLAQHCGARVHWRLVARIGLTTAGTLAPAAREPAMQADVAVVVTGVNDVVEQVPSHRAVAAREALANWLRNAMRRAHVAFAPLPPVHHFPACRSRCAGWPGAMRAAHDRRWPLGGTRGDVSLRAHAPAARPGVQWPDDGFHPGAPACRRCRRSRAIVAHVRRTPR